MNKGERIHAFVEDYLFVCADISQPRTISTEGDEVSISRGTIIGCNMGKNINVVFMEMLLVIFGRESKILFIRTDGQVLDAVERENGLIKLIDTIII